MTSRTVLGGIASISYLIAIGLFSLSSRAERSFSPAEMWLRWVLLGLAVLLALGLVAAVLTVFTLRRHSELIREPSGQPLTAATGRWLCAIAVAAAVVSVVCFLAALTTNSDAYHLLGFVPFVAAAIVSGILGRRPSR